MTVLGHMVVPLRSPYGEVRCRALALASKRTRHGNSSAYSSAFTDITSGSNGAYGAKPGWDAVTGWGTPLVSGLAAAVSSIAS